MSFLWSGSSHTHADRTINKETHTHAWACAHICMYVSIYLYMYCVCVCVCLCISKSVWNNLRGQRYTAQAIVFVYIWRHAWAWWYLETGWRWPTSSQARFTSSSQLRIWHVENRTSLIFTIRTHRSNVTYTQTHMHTCAQQTPIHKRVLRIKVTVYDVPIECAVQQSHDFRSLVGSLYL